MFKDDFNLEFQDISKVLTSKLSRSINGKDAILKLKESKYNWRQTEWLGFYYEFECFNILSKEIGGSIGPKYGNTEFDYKRNFVWDFKTHPEFKSDSKKNNYVILNDIEATESCIHDKNGLGYIIINGIARFEKTGEFKAWHDNLKGNISKYEIERVKRDAVPRTRKTYFKIKSIDAIFFKDMNDINNGLDDGWLKIFKQGRNSNGKPRKPKYQLKFDELTDRVKL